MSISIAPLHPADVDQLVDLHRRAFPKFFLSQLGPAFLTQFYRGFLTDPTSITAVARDDSGRVVGGVVGTTSPAGFFGRLLRRRMAGFVLASAQAAIADPRRTPRLLRGVAYRGQAGIAVDGALLSSICVDPALQGHGVGRTLITAWSHTARSRGADLAFLTTDAHDNDATNAFYLQSGWRCADTFTTAEGRMMNRYEKELG